MSETEKKAQIEGNLYLFERPELMTVEHHGALGLTPPAKRYSFCAKARAVPLTIGEIPAAARDYPVVLVAEDNPFPLAVVGMIDDVNLFVDENGNWEENRYIPGYIRRYPFGLASETDGDRLAIILDVEFEGLQPGGQLPLFENGEPTEATKGAIEYCKTYEQDRMLTEEFGRRLTDLGLVRNQTAQYTPTGSDQPKPFAQYFSIDEEKFNSLDDEKILECKKNGMLPIMYSMLMSLGNWRSILQRRAKRFNLTEEQILQQVIN